MKTSSSRFIGDMTRMVAPLPLLMLLGHLAMAQPATTPERHFWQTDKDVYTVVETNGVVYLGGAFTYVGPQSGKAGVVSLTTGQARYDFPNINGTVLAIASDGSGGWFLGGQFTSVGDYLITNLVHVLSNNQVDVNWCPAPDYRVLALACANNILYVGGDFQVISGLSRPYFAALDGTSGAAIAWAPQVNNNVNTLLLAGNILYLGGQFTSISKSSRSALAALDITLTTNFVTAWNPGVSGGSRVIYTLAVSGNTVYAGGDFTTIGGKPRNRIAALDAATGQASTWNPNANDAVRAMAISGSTLFVGGDFDSIGGRNRNCLAALDMAGLGGAISTWDANVDNSDASAASRVTALAVVDNTLYVAGQFVRTGGELRRGAASLDVATGQLKPWQPLVSSLSTDVKPTVWAMALDETRACLGGDFNSLGGYARGALAALDAASGAATAWNPNAGDAVYRLAIVDDLIYVGGIFTNIGTAARSRLASVDRATGAATDWHPIVTGTGGYIYCFNVTSNTLYASGWFSQINGKPVANLAAFDRLTGDLKESWTPNPNERVYTTFIDGNILYAGGRFTSIGSSNRNYIAALDLETGKATSWNPNADNVVWSLAAGQDLVYVGGDFTRIGGENRTCIAAIEKATATAAFWMPEAGGSGQVRVYAMNPGGNFLYVGGQFTSIGGEFRNRLASLDLLTGVSVSWNPNADGAVRSLLVSGNQMYVGGQFTKLGGQLHPYFAVFSLGSRFDLATLKRMTNGDIQCQLTDGGSAGHNLIIQASTNMLDWTTIYTGSPTGFPIDFTDTEAGTFSRRFYRALVQP